MGLDPVIVAQMKDHCNACVEFLEDKPDTSLMDAEDSGESQFMFQNMEKSGADLFVKQAGQAAAFDAFAVSECKQQVTSFSFKALSTQRTILVGLTASQDDSQDFAHGVMLEMKPDQKLVISGDTHSRIYQQGDIFTLYVSGTSIKAMKGKKIIHEWKNRAERPYLYPKIWIYDKGANLQVTDYLPAVNAVECEAKM